MRRYLPVPAVLGLLLLGTQLLSSSAVAINEPPDTSGLVPLNAPYAVQQPFQDHRYAMIGIWNPTPAEITYSFRWGDCEWRAFSIQPGERRWHAWRFDIPNQLTWPSATIRFDSDIRPEVENWRMYHLVGSPAPERNYWFGVRYSFKLDDIGYTIRLERLIDEVIF